MSRVPLHCHRCHALFTREASRTAAARGREHDYCSRGCAQAASAIQGQIARQKKAEKEPYALKPHQRFVFTPSEKARLKASPPAPMAMKGRDVEQARPAPQKAEIPVRLMPSVVVI